MSVQAYFRKCTSCKNEIGWRAKYYVCSVSTCNRKRTGLTFCSVSCWDAHVPIVRHRESWSEERTSPKDYATMIAEEKAEEEEHQRELDRQRRIRENDAQKAAEAAAAKAAASGPKVLRRRSSGDAQ